MLLDGEKYSLLQFHFHHPGEANATIEQLWSQFPNSGSEEDVTLDTPVELSQTQIGLFAQRFPDNHRPVQEIGDRVLNGDN